MKNLSMLFSDWAKNDQAERYCSGRNCLEYQKGPKNGHIS